MGTEPRIDAAALRLGADTTFGARVQLGAIGGPAESIVVGDNCAIGDDVRILAPRVRIGDFVTIHHHTTIYGYDEVCIGACSWIGQNVILNCTAPLRLGRGCTVSAYSTVWTHFSGGDPLEGCNFNHQRPCTLGEDAWIGVQCSVAPVQVGAKALLLAGSVLTKDVPPNRVWGGNPAADLTDKLGPPYSERSPAEKFSLLCELLREYQARVQAVEHAAGASAPELPPPPQNGVFRLGGITVTMRDLPEDGSSIFDVNSRTYSKLRTPEEVGFMRFLLPLTKFYPRSVEFDCR
jgi:acetyltransferase-like isoleucine patch superfamily enzyme